MSDAIPRAVIERPCLVRPSVAVERAEPRAKLLMLGEPAALMRALPGVELPLRPAAVTIIRRVGECLWLRPHQRLLLLETAADAAAVEMIRSLRTPEAWVFDAGARYVEFSVHGPGAAAVINGGCSLDLRDAAFPAQSCTQSRIDQCPVLLLRTSREDFAVFVERPLAPHLWLWLCRAAGNL